MDVGWVVGLQLDDDTHKRRSNQSVPRRPWYGEACFLLPGRILDLIFVILKPVFGLLLQCRSFIAPTVSDSYKISKYGKFFWDHRRVGASQRFWRCAQAHWRMGPISGLGHWNIQVVSNKNRALKLNWSSLLQYMITGALFPFNLFLGYVYLSPILTLFAPPHWLGFPLSPHLISSPSSSPWFSPILTLYAPPHWLAFSSIMIIITITLLALPYLLRLHHQHLHKYCNPSSTIWKGNTMSSIFQVLCSRPGTFAGWRETGTCNP